MTTATPMTETGLSGAAPLYTRVEPLNPQAHGKLGVKQLDAPFSFVTSHFVPILLPEFPQAATAYPLIFAGDDKAPLAVMGIDPSANLFFAKDGRMTEVAYIPAYIRRFPFITAQDESTGRGIVCLDVAADIVSEDGQWKIFEGEKLTEYGQNCVDFCQKFEEDRARSEMILSQIKALDIFHTRQIKHTPKDQRGNPVGEEILIAEFFAVEEPKVHKLSGEQLTALRDTGALAYIYAHLISMSNWEKLITMEVNRISREAAANAN